MGANGTLFDLGEYQEPGKERKAPESQAEKELKRIRDMEERELRNLERKLERGKTLTAAQAQRLKEYRERLGALSGGDLPEGCVKIAKEVAEHFGKSIRTIRNWAGRGMPQNPDNYDLNAIEEWALNEGLIKERISPASTTGGLADTDGDQGKQYPDRAHYELEIKRLDSELKAHKLAISKGEYVKKEDIAREWAGRITEFAKALDYQVGRFPPLLEGKSQAEMRTIIGNENYEMRVRLARTGRFCPETEYTK